ncbi:MAG: hypothetical protein OFPI_13580 [Osedax symbiont Rs2]|nr:MAG: hypothetical protein OFPI_13580 [Osedax symbiont Rs2]
MFFLIIFLHTSKLFILNKLLIKITLQEKTEHLIIILKNLNLR